MASHPNVRLTEGESMALGGVAAFIQGIMLQPTLYWKNAGQQGMPFSLNPVVVYRGLAASLFNEVGSMGVQFGITAMFNNLILGSETRPLTTEEELGSAFAGGAVAALFTSPVELVMIQQQKYGGSVFHTTKNVAQKYGLGSAGVFRGLTPAMMRDSIYVGGMLGVTPVIQKFILANTDWGTSGAGFVASLVGGIFAGGVSAPLDTIKTCMQGDLGQKEYKGPWDATRSLFAQEGIKRFFNGAVWRIINITGTILIANECRNQLPPYMFPDKFRSDDIGNSY